MTMPAAPSLPLARRHARMGRYALWQSRDFVMNIAIISIILFALLGFLWIMRIHSMEEPFVRGGAPNPVPDALKISIFLELYGVFATVAPIICLSGIVSQDRSLGYTRFLFSKPAGVRAFYVQSALVRLIGFLLVGLALVWWYSVYEPTGLSARFLGDMLVNFVSIGGIILLLSVFTRYDGLVAIIVLLVSVAVRAQWATATGIKHAVTYLLPPVMQLGEVHRWAVGLNHMQTLAAVEFPTKWALWNMGYGLACAVLGLYLLRKISLTKA